MQQSYAGAAGVVESVSLAELVDDALRLNASSFEKYHIEVVRDYADIPRGADGEAETAANPHEPDDQRQGLRSWRAPRKTAA